MEPYNKSLNFISPTKSVIPQSLKLAIGRVSNTCILWASYPYISTNGELVVWIPRIPVWKGLFRGTPRIPNHRAPKNQLTISWTLGICKQLILQLPNQQIEDTSHVTKFLTKFNSADKVQQWCVPFHHNENSVPTSCHQRANWNETNERVANMCFHSWNRFLSRNQQTFICCEEKSFNKSRLNIST